MQRILLVVSCLILSYCFSKAARATFNSTRSIGTWVQLPIEKLQITKVTVDSDGVIYASCIDKTEGAILIHSKNEGKTWSQVSVPGSNTGIALTRDNEVVCGAGTKMFCLYLNDKPPEELKYNFELRTIDISGFTYAVYPYKKQGIAYVGAFQVPYTLEKINGVLYNEYVGAPGWKYSDIQLSRDDGYYAMAASFPSENTWFVVSGSWPAQSSDVHTMLSGRLAVAPGDINHLNNYHYEFWSLRSVKKDLYFGAISKTSDGGKTWTKVFDSKNYFYLNQIDCITDSSCLAVGEGSSSTYILMTKDSGNTWDIALRLDGKYSLHSSKMITENEMWVAGGMLVEDTSSIKENNMKLVGIYYYSDDGGETWAMTTSDGYAYDISFANKDIGYAATIHDDHCSITKLHK